MQQNPSGSKSHSSGQTVVFAEPLHMIPPSLIKTQVVNLTQEQLSPSQTKNVDNPSSPTQTENFSETFVAPDSDSPTHVSKTIPSPQKSPSPH
ncbi:hypothetical protein DRJ81_15845, partial [Enterococcus faecalis]